MTCVCLFSVAVQLNPILKPLSWLLGTWESDEPGEGTFPTIKPFRYTEKLYFSHVGQPVINFTYVNPAELDFVSAAELNLFLCVLHHISSSFLTVLFRFNAFHAESNKPLHRECGFIRIQPGTNRVAFIIAQNSGRHQLNTSKFLILRAVLRSSDFYLKEEEKKPL